MVTGALLLLVAGAVEPAGRAVTLRGDVKVKHAHDPAAPTDDLKPGQEVHPGDILSTRAGAGVRLLMRDKTLIDLGPLSQITLTSYEVQASERRRTARIHTWFGHMWTRVSKSLGGGVDYQVTTPNAVAGVRGTEFVVSATEGGGSDITVIEGQVEVGSSTGGPPQLVGAMQRGSVGADGQVAVAAVTTSEVTALVDSVTPNPSLDDGQADDRMQGAPAAPSDAPAEGPAADERPPTDPPLLELDPATGDTRVRGKLEVKP